ncbi:MAG: lipopolysaccharide heptosyltransferase II [Deltaproteobacteria bacterium]|nr:lipopolysaccharide heptosyltransferase II [Deltaproteobacteria bacterium]
MKILIIKLSSIGDVVHTLPALYALRNAYPSAKIDWLVEEDASNILIGHHLLNDVFTVKKNGWFRDFKGTYNVAKNIKASDYDIVLDFQGLFKSGIWVFLSGGKRRIGFDKSREMSYLFLNERLPAYDPDKHAVERYLDIVKYLKIAAVDVKFPIFISENEKKKVSDLLRANAVGDGEPFIIVNYMARWKTKLWDIGKFAGLCNEIMDRFTCRVVIVGASYNDKNKEIAFLTNNRIIDLSGKTTLKELAHLMSFSSAVITVDSGPMHIAAAMGVPVIAIFGPTAPWRTGPYGKIHSVVRKELPCSPCFSRVCKGMDNACMKEIEVRDVLPVVEAKLNYTQRGATSGLYIAT